MQMPNFSPGQRLRWGGEIYEVVAPPAEGQMRLAAPGLLAPRVVEHRELARALFAGEVTLLPAVPSPPAPPRELADYSPHQQAVARWRLAAIQPLLALSPIGGATATYG